VGVIGLVVSTLARAYTSSRQELKLSAITLVLVSRLLAKPTTALAASSISAYLLNAGLFDPLDKDFTEGSKHFKTKAAIFRAFPQLANDAKDNRSRASVSPGVEVGEPGLLIDGDGARRSCGK